MLSGFLNLAPFHTMKISFQTITYYLEFEPSLGKVYLQTFVEYEINLVSE